MDSLDKLPVGKNEQSPDEKEVMDRFFDNDDTGDSPVKTSGKIDWKVLGMITGAFVLLANPWIDGLLSKIPYAESDISKFGIKVLLFAIIVLAIMMFAK